MASSKERAPARSFIRPLLICGAVITLGYVGMFAILQAPVLWYALRPDPIRSLIPGFFAPINAAFPDRWVNLERTDPLAFLVLALYIVMLILVTLPLVYLLRLLSRVGTGALNEPRSERKVLAIVFAITLVIMVVLLFARGLLSTDVYSYAWYARILAVHGASPMSHAPVEFPPDPEGAFYWIGWPDEPSVYGPVWVMVSTLFFQVGNALTGTFSAQLLSLRILADLTHLANAWLVWLVLGQLLSGGVPARRPGHRLRRSLPREKKVVRMPVLQSNSHGQARHFALRTTGLLFYVWNPLLLIEFAGSGHNDVLMITFVLLAVWLHLKGYWPLAASALALAALVKLPALLLLPGYLWYLFWRHYEASAALPVRMRVVGAIIRPLMAVGVALLTAVLLYLPFWEGPRTLLPPVSGPANRLYLHTLGYDIWWNGPQISADIAGVTSDRSAFIASVRDFLDANLRPLFLVLFGITAVALTWAARTVPRLLVSWGWLMLAAAITQGWFWPWYVSWSVALAAVAGSHRLRVATMVFSISALLLYVEEQVLAQHFRLFLDWSGVFIMLPPLLYIGYTWLANRRRTRSPSRTTVAPRRRARVPGLASD